MSAPPDYELYLRSEWDLFVKKPLRAQSALKATAGLMVEQLLDIGCGAGQELLPYVEGQRAFGIALDTASCALQVGRELFAERRIVGRVAFVRGAAERLPIRSGTMDLVICRLALPYTDNARALAEMARVLRPDGLIVLKYHHARFYTRRMKTAIKTCDFRSMAYFGRVLLSGLIYHLTGRQPRNGLTGTECFQTSRTFRAELLRQQLAVREYLSESDAATPVCVLTKSGTTCARSSKF